MDPEQQVYGWETKPVYCSIEDPRGRCGLDFVFSVNAEPYRIYCLEPSNDDNCPVGICSNADIAGLLVRVAHYTTALCLIILIFHAPKRVKDAFYYQMSTVYALLITCSISLYQGNVTELHAMIAIFIALSPASIYFLAYSIRAFWGEHRLNEVLGRRKYLNRGMVFFAVGIWIAIFVYTSLESKGKRLAQASCGRGAESQEQIIWWMDCGPYYWFICDPWVGIAPTSVALLWLVSILSARKEIWPPGERYRPKFVTVWKTITRRYPFVFFITIGFVPMTFWIWRIETIVPRSDQGPSFGFGQILALFIAVPPALQVCQLFPQLWSWIINLSWIAWCWRKPPQTGDSAKQIDFPLEAVYYTHPEGGASSEERIGRFYEGKQETRESGALLNPNQHHES